MTENKKTLVLGASPNPGRYSFTATSRLLEKGHEAVPLGVREGKIAGVEIISGQPMLPDIHTVSIYLRPDYQEQYYDYILDLKPRRIIFNPGAENPELEQKFRDAGIVVLEACTLVMLSAGLY